MFRTRREFLRAMPGIAALPASWNAFARALQTTPDPNSDSYWALVKRQFPLEDGLIYLNAANVCPASRPVLDRHAEFLRDFHSNPSFQNRDKYDALKERLRGKLALLLGAAADEIAITRNTSEANNIIVHGVELKPGDEVLITDHNHPSNNDAWRVQARRAGFTIRSVPVPVPPVSADQLIASIKNGVGPKTRVVAFTHVTNTTGVLYPAREIAELARGREIWVHIDGAQSFGALTINLHELGCDSYSASAHKWAMGPLEAGLLYVRKERIAQLWPSIVSAHWSDEEKTARRFEVFGQRDDPRLVAFEAAVDFLNLIGQKNVEARMRALASRLKGQLREIRGIRLKTSAEPGLSAGVVKFEIPSLPVQKGYDTLWATHRISSAMTPAGDSAGIRLCPHVYNSPDEIDAAVKAISELV